jgi:hypothetical protein
MELKVRLEPKINLSEIELIRKMKQKAEETIVPVTEKTLEESLFGKEIDIHELIP